MTAKNSVRHSLAPLAPLALVAALLGLVPPALAQDAEAPPQDAAAPAAMPKASERLGMSQGRHRFSIFYGVQGGGLAREVSIITSPLNADPFAPQIDLESSSEWGVRYGYQFHGKWGAEVSWTEASSDLSDGETFDRAAAETVVEAAVSDPAERQALLDRLEARSGPFSIDTSYLDLGFVYVTNPKGRWMGEVNAGLGWSWGSVSSSPAILERLVASYVEPGSADPVVLANTLPSEDPTMGEACPTDNDPCVELNDGDGLTWHVGGGVSYAFTDTVHLRLNTRFRWVEQVLDPGDSFLQMEGTLGLSFLVGGK